MSRCHNSTAGSRTHVFFFFNDTATTEIYTLSLHDALPIYATFDKRTRIDARRRVALKVDRIALESFGAPAEKMRSEEHTSELQSRLHLVCRLLLEKKKSTYAIST